MPLNADQVAELLEEIGRRLELTGEVPFKARAYYKAADSLRALPEPLDRYIAEDRLRDIPGVGEAIQEKIEILHGTGTHRTLERLRQDVPAGVLEMLDVPNLTKPRIAALHQQLGITSVEELEAAAQAGTLAKAKGFGPKVQEKILEGIRLMRENAGLMLMHRARARAEAACVRIVALRPEVDLAVPAGEVRRGCDVVRDLTVVARVRSDVQSELNIQQKPNIRFLLNGDPPLVLSGLDQFGLALLVATGSAAHVEQLRAVAGKRDLSLREDGLYRGDEALPCPEELDVYQALALPFIEPELREGENEVELARAGKLPKLIRLADMRGVLHCHTDASDGGNTLEEMAEAARRLGYEYFGVADHSQLASYAGGLKPDRVVQQHVLADRLNAGYAGTGFRIFKGTECDILADGRLDFDDALLATFDYVVASVHSRFSMDREEQTARIIRAVSNPYVTILGHMTGRLLLSREGYPVDVEAVLRACAEHGVAVEINANPHRLDLDWRWHRRALELGCMLSINPDAHSTGELELVKWGVLVARKGGVPAERVINCMGLGEMEGYLGRRC
jgi:DNA polymerase (family X)